MQMKRAVFGTVTFFLLAPVGLGLVVPAVITGWDSPDPSPSLFVAAAGWMLAATGLATVAVCFARFVSEGRGTPAPVAPTKTLVVGGLYRYVRNPMYVGVIAMICGQAVALLSAALLLYGTVFTATVATFVRLYEEPVLEDAYGESFRRYRSAVPGWIPRLRPWRG
jgi:protein-S-isoprenylcysteine O-methyltransferase Ste14